MMKQSIYFCLCLFFLVGICCACKPKLSIAPSPEDAAPSLKDAEISLAVDLPKDVVDSEQKEADISSAKESPNGLDTIQCQYWDIKCENGAVNCEHLRVAPSGPEFRICLFEPERDRLDDVIKPAYLTLSRLDNPSIKYDDIALKDKDINIDSAIWIEDINFDGKMDFLVNEYRVIATSFLWDENNQNFVEFSRLSGTCNLEFHSDKQTIVNGCRGLDDDYNIDTYRWVNGDLVIVESRTECYFGEGECEQKVSD